MTPRRIMAWLLPGILSLMLLAIVLLAIFVPPEMQNGDPLHGVLIAGGAFILAQALILWLTERWARTQP